ncbi:MAG: hypothetical protein NC180_06705 [Muribaculaceae bacterium]|nr:hypothetical protein [Roseburia sp.]MCM1429843.1 hypothetical protein [Muribaculaceae bacterium]MCM1492894.1 hypothetical protein [Muribaculaceae bacterium]
MRFSNSNIEELLEKQKAGSLYCFGAGGELAGMLGQFGYLEWNKKLKGIADNHRCGTTYKIGEAEYPVISPEELRSSIDSEDAILITSTYIYEIYRQLESYPELENTRCYIYRYMACAPLQEQFDWEENKAYSIPPTIHYCWFGGGSLPDLYKRCMESWRRFCPDYEIKEWNEDNCDLNENLFVRQAYDCGKYAFVSDYFRLKVVYEYGGIYLDTDVELLKNLDPLRKNEAYCGLMFPGVVATGLGFGAMAHHIIIKRLMDLYQDRVFLKEDGRVYDTPCPELETGAMVKWGMRGGNRTQVLEGMTIYPTQVLNALDGYTGQLYKTENSFSVHHYAGSWVDKKRAFSRDLRHTQVKEIINEGKVLL